MTIPKRLLRRSSKRIKKSEYTKRIIGIVRTLFKDKYELPKYELLRLNLSTLANLYHILNELKQKRLEDYV